MLWTTGMTMYAEAAIECRDSASARPMFDQLAPWAGRLSYSAAAVEGPVSHYLGGLATVLGRYDEADAYFAKSAAASASGSQVLRRQNRPRLGAGCRGAHGSPGDAERGAPVAHPGPSRPQWPMDTRRCSDVLRRLSTP